MQRLLRQDLVGRVELSGHDVGVNARGELDQQVVQHAHSLDRGGPRVLKNDHCLITAYRNVGKSLQLKFKIHVNHLGEVLCFGRLLLVPSGFVQRVACQHHPHDVGVYSLHMQVDKIHNA